MITDSDISIAEGIPWYDYAESVQRVVIGDGITSVGNYAFTSCINLQEAVLTDSIQRIGDSAFYSCRGFESIILPESLISIGEYAFASCESLAEIEIPDSVESIGELAFSGCSSLEYVSGLNSVSNIGSDTFSYCTSITDLSFIEGIASISDGMFIECDGLKNVTIPSSVSSIGHMAFASCDNLENIIIPDSVTSISGDAFADCTALHNITIPAGVASIGEYALGYSYDVSGADTNYIPIEGFTIYGYAGTAAETYANKNSFNFVDLTDPEIAIIPEKTDEIYVRGSGKDAVIYCTGEFADFVSVEMDGEMVDPSNYKVTEGSTVLTFVASYLDTLSVGRHTVTLNYIDTSISTFLTIVEENGGNSTLTGDGTGNNTNAGNGTNTGSANKTDSAVQTGDQSNIVLWVVLGVCSLVVCTVALTKRKRYEM